MWRSEIGPGTRIGVAVLAAILLLSAPGLPVGTASLEPGSDQASVEDGPLALHPHR